MRNLRVESRSFTYVADALLFKLTELLNSVRSDNPIRYNICSVMHTSQQNKPQIGELNTYKCAEKWLAQELNFN